MICFKHFQDGSPFARAHHQTMPTTAFQLCSSLDDMKYHRCLGASDRAAAACRSRYLPVLSLDQVLVPIIFRHASRRRRQRKSKCQSHHEPGAAAPQPTLIKTAPSSPFRDSPTFSTSTIPVYIMSRTLRSFFLPMFLD
ncbi:hypothetical protein M413DRAFT_326716 [Hebeloma cylindrosporum]|uniref:Uncharacterized protein n=1 Tax=Hebeloma cylindrosporum TaxID=76867 RepID=A0A0C3BG23_HEBCY|nr:hypothetical protein M413DRAFT_326716 [Hebeloma cylindrosporum h7]